MKLTKYPVISPNGNTYRVKVQMTGIDRIDPKFNRWNVDIYEKRGHFGWRLIGNINEQTSTPLEAVKLAIVHFEPDYLTEYAQKRQFNEWNGDMREISK